MNSHGQTHPAEKMLFKPRQLHKLMYIPLYTHSALPQKQKGNGICVGLQKGLLRALQSWFPGPATRLQVLLLCVLLVFRQCKRGCGSSRPFPSLCLFARGKQHAAVLPSSITTSMYVPVCVFLIHHQTALCLRSLMTTLLLPYGLLPWGTSLKISNNNSCCQ